MISIITYISVLERTKEIGILRSIGASKKDISRVFNAETLIVGATAGILGIITTLILNIPINIIVGNRGGGKSYGAKLLAIDNFIKKKEQFGYIRRYKDDLKEHLTYVFDTYNVNKDTLHTLYDNKG